MNLTHIAGGATILGIILIVLIPMALDSFITIND